MTLLDAAVLLAQDAPQPRGPATSIFLLQILAFVAIIYFLMIRPKVQQEKKHRERLSQLRKGDEVVTAGGIIGRIVHLKDDQVTVKSGETRLEIARDRIAEVRSGAAEDKK